MGYKYYKKHIQNLIDHNPTEVRIARNVKTDDGYGGTTSTPQEQDATILLYDAKAKREVLTDHGKSFISTSVTKALTTGEEDLQEGDKVEAAGKTYKVIHLEDYFGICKQAELERIK